MLEDDLTVEARLALAWFPTDEIVRRADAGQAAHAAALAADDPWKLMVSERCKYCGVPRGDLL